MQVVVVASQKGGAGKTTLAGHLAVAAERAGMGPVAIIDTDRQGSLAAWWNARAAATPGFVATSFPRLMTDLEALAAQGTQIVFIDTPPAISLAIRDVIVYATLVIVPARPSPHDLRAIGATRDLVAAANKPLLFVINGAAPRAKITADAVAALAQHGAVAPVVLHQRNDYAAAMTDGRTVMELDDAGASAREVTQLWAHVATLLAGLRDRSVFGRFQRLFAQG